MQITFGKYQGTEIEQLPITYLIWGKENISSEKWKTVLKAEYLRRTQGKKLSEDAN